MLQGPYVCPPVNSTSWNHESFHKHRSFLKQLKDPFFFFHHCFHHNQQHNQVSAAANCASVAEFKFRFYNEVKGVWTAAQGPQILQRIQLHMNCHLYVWDGWLKLWCLWISLWSPKGWGHRIMGPYQACRTSRISVWQKRQAGSHCQCAVR